MPEPEAHPPQVRLAHAAQQRTELPADPAVEIHVRAVARDAHRELLGDRARELGVRDDERVLGFLARERGGEERLERRGEAPLVEQGNVLDGRGGGLEAVNRRELEARREGEESVLQHACAVDSRRSRGDRHAQTGGALGRLKLLPQVLARELGLVVDLEQAEACESKSSASA